MTDERVEHRADYPRLTEAERRELDRFCRAVLLPIIADHRIDAPEDGVLNAGYTLYRVGELVRRNPKEVDDIVREAISGTCVTDGPLPPDSDDITDLFRRVVGSEALTRNDKRHVVEWLSTQAEAHEELLENLVKPPRRGPEVPYPQWKKEHLETILPSREDETHVEDPGTDVLAETVSAKTDGAISPTPPEPEHPKEVSETPSETPQKSPNPVLEVELDKDQIKKIKKAVLNARDFERWSPGVMKKAVKSLSKNRSLPFAFSGDGHRLGFEDFIVCVQEVPDETTVWFVGDLHGDLLALESALFYIGNREGAGDNSIVVFLGDLVDDGADGPQVFLRVVDEVLSRPGTVLLLAGNHDEALVFDREAEHFVSAVSPSEFADFLNDNLEDEVISAMGRLVVDVFKTTPRALFLPDGVFAAHGGIPHTDLHPTIESCDDLNQPACLRDFVWTRAHKRARRKIPNRCSKGCQFGFEDYSRFCDVASKALGMPVETMIRGHDHVDERYLLYPNYGFDLLTVNALSHRLSREWGGEYERTPCLARWRPGQQVEIHRLIIPGDLIREIYPEPESEEAGE